MFRILLASAITIASLAQATAAEQVTVPANRKSMVGSHVIFSRDTCSGSTVPNMRVGRKPKHGKVDFRTVSGKLSEGRCAGKPMRGKAVFYTPQRGFKGSDNFSVVFEYDYYEGAARRTSTSYSYDITVK
ncbi:hypothetical protein [Roseibium aggregatum]|uniref:Secreted protein n=1 Tax=Roseibium aggregatum TaxID=187304 RepID=A0A926NY78_9HYPH|nr:hypothetical protein [Roseibium aggregatum]MBD1547529.1 hypothetical protein [Roseibium aggregatum]